MSLTAHVYRIHIRAPRERVWSALLDPAFTREYFHGTAYAMPPAPGEPFLSVLPDGRPAVDGVIEVLDPPHRLVQTWHFRYDPTLEAEPPGRVEWILDELGPELTRLTLRHGDLFSAPLTWAHVQDGWLWIVDGLKTLLETGAVLPAPEQDPLATEPEPTAESVRGGWHRIQAVEANNGTYPLVTTDPWAAVEQAYAAAWHWDRAAGATPVNRGRAAYLIAKAWVAVGEGRLALRYANECMGVCQTEGLGDFDLAYAWEVRARALGLLGDALGSAQAWACARAVEIAAPEDRAILEADFADAP